MSPVKKALLDLATVVVLFLAIFITGRSINTVANSVESQAKALQAYGQSLDKLRALVLKQIKTMEAFERLHKSQAEYIERLDKVQDNVVDWITVKQDARIWAKPKE